MSRVVPGDRVGGFQRWELPNMDPPGERASSATDDEMADLPRRPTAEEIESIQQAAHEEGYAAGFEQGVREGRSAGETEVRERARRLEQLLAQLAEPLAGAEEAVEEELTQLAIDIARKLLRRELRTDRGEIVAVVREAVSLLPSTRLEVRVELHPADLVLVREALSLQEDAEAWRLVENPALSRGGCKVSAEAACVDATVERRLGAVIAAVLGSDRTDHGDGGGGV